MKETHRIRFSQGGDAEVPFLAAASHVRWKRGERGDFFPHCSFHVSGSYGAFVAFQEGFFLFLSTPAEVPVDWFTGKVNFVSFEEFGIFFNFLKTFETIV